MYNIQVYYMHVEELQDETHCVAGQEITSCALNVHKTLYRHGCTRLRCVNNSRCYLHPELLIEQLNAALYTLDFIIQSRGRQVSTRVTTMSQALTAHTCLVIHLTVCTGSPLQSDAMMSLSRLFPRTSNTMLMSEKAAVKAEDCTVADQQCITAIRDSTGASNCAYYKVCAQEGSLSMTTPSNSRSLPHICIFTVLQRHSMQYGSSEYAYALQLKNER